MSAISLPRRGAGAVPSLPALLALLAGLALPCTPAGAAPLPMPDDGAMPQLQPRPVPRGHPLVGLWEIEVPGTSCLETYEVRPDGTMSVSSGSQAVESHFLVSSRPTRLGFYAWVDQVVYDNGLPDCLGGRGEAGQVALNFVWFDRSGREFLLCDDESLDACVGPFRRLDDEA